MTTLTKAGSLAAAASLAALLTAVVPAFAQTTAAPAPAAPAAPAPAAPASPPPNYNTQYTAFFDGYYAYQFNNPKTDSTYYTGEPGTTYAPASVPGTLGNGVVRAYDDRQNAPTLALGEVNIFQTPKPGGIGYKTTLGAGDVADVNAAGAPGNPAPETGEGRFKNVLQAYGTWLFGSSGAGLDFGKFYTPIGYEVTESNGNMNETHSIPFEMIPFYHFGVRAYTPSYNGLVLTGYVVQAVYNSSEAGVQNDTNTPSFVGNITWTDPKGKWVGVYSLGVGLNKYNLGLAGYDPTENGVAVSDLDLTYNIDANHTIGFDGTSAATVPKSEPAAQTDSADATDTGLALYYKQILTPKTDFALRYSDGTFKESSFDSTSSTSLTAWEATGTYEYHETSNVTTRFEYQHANANHPEFADDNDILSKKSQDVVEVAELVSF
ncbi:MAG: outer membrane beta-barrel protein [Capsulimonadaceae bacterium]